MSTKVLIIDDETDFCLIMKSYFMKKNWELLSTHSLNEGINVLKDFKPDILFLDNNLPDGNGWDEVWNIVEVIPQAKVFLISAHRDASTFMNINKNITIWEKPISFSKLDTMLAEQHSQD